MERIHNVRGIRRKIVYREREKRNYQEAREQKKKKTGYMKERKEKKKKKRRMKGEREKERTKETKERDLKVADPIVCFVLRLENVVDVLDQVQGPRVLLVDFLQPVGIYTHTHIHIFSLASRKTTRYNWAEGKWTHIFGREFDAVDIQFSELMVAELSGKLKETIIPRRQ